MSIPRDQFAKDLVDQIISNRKSDFKSETTNKPNPFRCRKIINYEGYGLTATHSTTIVHGEGCPENTLNLKDH